jgi:glycosyltransferase involved in cell wall biosynthesis
MALRRIAYLSPLPPEASGIADYSVELLAGLTQQVEVDLFSAGTAHLPSTLAGLTARTYAKFPDAHARQPYDAVVYHLGNNADFHTEIYRLALRIPGIVVLHEYMLHHLLRGMSSAREYVEAMRYSYGQAGAGIARRLLESDHPAESWTYPLFEPVVDASLGVIVHSDATRRRILRSRPNARVAVVPLHLSLDGLPAVTDDSRRALRRDLGISDAGLVVASFGHISPAKRVDVALRAFARFRRDHPDSVYVLAGELSWAYTRIRELLDGELGERVVLTGRLPFPRLLEFMDLADVAINLRYPAGGETSATCIRLLGLGTPVIVSTGDCFADIPDGCCARVEPGRFEEAELVALLEALSADPHLRRDMSTAASRWANVRHHLDRSVARYRDFIESTIAEAPSAGAAVAPLAAYARADVTTKLLADVAEAAADVGIRENDRQVLPALAEAFVDAGLAPSRRPPS